MITDDGIYPPQNWLNGYGNPFPPARGQWAVDPIFGERYKRITDCVADGLPSAAIEYINNCAITADNQWLRFTTTVGSERIINLATGEIRFCPNGSSGSGIWADPANADDFIFIGPVNQPSLRRFHISTGKVDIVADYSALTAQMSAGKDYVTFDGRYVSCSDHAPHGDAGVCYMLDTHTGQVVSTFDTHAPPFFPGAVFDANISPCGRYWWAQVNVAHSINSKPPWSETWTTEPTPRRVFSWEDVLPVGGHNTVTVDRAGRGWKVMQATGGANGDNHVWRFPADGGDPERIVQMGWFNNPDQLGCANWESYLAGHSTPVDDYVWYSCQPGARDGDPAHGWKPYYAELMRFKIDGSEPPQRLLHHRSSQFVPQFGYWAKCKISPSYDGKVCAWSSNFRRLDTEPQLEGRYADVYLSGAPQGAVKMDIDTFEQFLVDAGVAYTRQDPVPPSSGVKGTLTFADEDGSDTLVAKFDEVTGKFENVDAQ